MCNSQGNSSISSSSPQEVLINVSSLTEMMDQIGRQVDSRLSNHLQAYSAIQAAGPANRNASNSQSSSSATKEERTTAGSSD